MQYWPVALAAAPDGRLFYAELLTGNIRIWRDGQLLPEPFASITDVSNHGESGLLGLALHPEFPEEPFVYAMYTVDYPETGFPLIQRVVRFRDDNGTGRDYTVIIDDLPATTTGLHNGGRIAFGPDGKMYLSHSAIPTCAGSRPRPHKPRRLNPAIQSRWHHPQRQSHYLVLPCLRHGLAKCLWPCIPAGNRIFVRN